MMDSELTPFIAVCNDLMRVFPKRMDDHDKNQLHRDYFKALRRFSFGQVEHGAEAWMQRGKFFPKPAEWIDAIPQRKEQAIEYPAMSEQDARDYRHAELLRYEDAPCHCRECVGADVTEKPLRFVPDVSADGGERKVRDGDRVVVAGHWAHGNELRRWYVARANFYEAFVKRFGGRPGI